jgi:hypothetical protein
MEDSPNDANEVPPSRTGLRPRAGLSSQQAGTGTSEEYKENSYDDKYVDVKKESGEDSEEYDDDWSASEEGTRRSGHKTAQATGFIPYTSSILTSRSRPLGASTTSESHVPIPRTSPTPVRRMAELVARAHAHLTNAKRDPRYNEHIDAVLLEARHIQRLSMLIHLTQAEKEDIVDFVLTCLDDSIKEYVREWA